MTERVETTEEPMRKIRPLDRPQKRIDPKKFAEAIGAEKSGRYVGSIDIVGLAELAARFKRGKIAGVA